MLKVLIKLLKLTKQHIGWMLFASLIGFFTIGSSVGLIMTSAFLIAKAALQPSIADLSIAIVGVRFFGISRGVFRYLERYISHDVTFNILKKIRVWFFELVDAQYPIKTNEYKSSDLLNKSVSNIEDLEDFFVRIISPVIVALLTFVLLLIVLGTYSINYAIAVGVIFLISSIIVPLISFLLSKKILVKIAELKKELTNLSIDQLQGMTELLVYGGKNSFQKKVEKTNKLYIKEQRKLYLINSISESLNTFLMYFSVVLILILAIPDITNNMLDGIYLGVLALGTLAFFEAVLPLPQSLVALEKSYKAGKEIFEFETDQSEETLEEEKQNTIRDYSIDITSLKFSYDEDIEVYNNLNLHIPQNKVTVLIGESGVGKSTISNLLLKRWKSSEGEIKIGNTNLNDISENEITNIISVLPQTIHLFNLSIKENLRFANLEVTDDEIMNALKKVNLGEFVSLLPNGVNEIVGEFGVKLSGGEKQRLGIAQCLLRNSPIMIFDEPTSNLDKYNAKFIMDLIYELSKTKTILLITHNLENLDKADKIHLMEKGRIIKSGTFTEILDSKKKLYET